MVAGGTEGLELLADGDLLARLREPAGATVPIPLVWDERLATGGVLDLEILYSARSHRDVVATREELAGYPRLDVAQADFGRPVAVMRLLVRRGQHRVAGLPDLLLAAVAERHAGTLPHDDAHFDLVVAVTGQAMRAVVARGSVP